MGPTSIKNRLSSRYLKNAEYQLSGEQNRADELFELPSLDIASDLFDQAEKYEDRASEIQLQDESLALRLQERAHELKNRATAFLQMMRKECQATE
jgi:hypothetical protein